jgi:hypothetical protein
MCALKESEAFCEVIILLIWHHPQMVSQAHVLLDLRFHRV